MIQHKVFIKNSWLLISFYAIQQYGFAKIGYCTCRYKVKQNSCVVVLQIVIMLKLLKVFNFKSRPIWTIMLLSLLLSTLVS